MSAKAPEKVLFERLNAEYLEAKNARKVLADPRWRDNVSLVMPEFGEFGAEEPWPDNRYDATATDAVRADGDAMFGNICNPATIWFRYKYADDKLNDVSQYRDRANRLTERMLDVFRRSNIYEIAPEWFGTYVGMAMASMDIQPHDNDGTIVCRVDHIRSVYVAGTSRNHIETIYQPVWLTVDQAVEKWGEEKLDAGLRKIFASTPSSTLYEFLNVIKRRPTGERKSLETAKMPFASYWLRPGDERQVIIEESGYRTFPKPTARWAVWGSNPYGRGLTDDVMPDIRTINSMARSYMLAGQRAADPPKFLPDEGRSWSTDPGSDNYYRDPNRKAYYLEAQGSFRWNDEMFATKRGHIRSGYKVNHFLMMRPEETNKQRTAREVLEIKKEQANVTGAPVARAEMSLDQIHERFLQIEADAGRLEGLLPPVDSRGNLPAMRVEYLGPLSQLQREVLAQENLLGAIENAAPVIQLFPATIHVIKKPWLLVTKILRSKDFPEQNIASDQEYAAALEEEAAKAQAAKEAVLKQELAKGTDPNAKPQQGSPAAMMLERTA